MNQERQLSDSKARTGDLSRLAFLIFVPWAIALVFAIRDWNGDLQIARREETVPGEITANVREDHNRFDYTYSIGGSTYLGSTSFPGNRGIGARVLVYYDPLHPSNSQLESFASPGTRPVPIVLISAMTLLGFFSVRRWLRKQTIND